MAFLTLINLFVFDFANVAAPLVAASDDSEGAALVPLILLASGFVYYFYIYRRYRNADKRHTYESETSAHMDKLMVVDQLLQHKKGLSNARMSGTNHLRIQGALNTKSKKLPFDDIKFTRNIEE